MNLEANRAIQSVIRKVISNEQEIIDISKINNHILQFYQNLFKEKQSTSENRFNSLLNDLNIASLNSEEMLSCEGNLTEQEIYKSLTSFKNNKSPGNDGLIKEFYCCFWNDIKYSLEQNLNCDENLEQYGIYKNELNDISNDISNGIKIRSKCDWYEFGKKSNNFFVNLEANRATQSVIHKVISNEQEITDISKINNHILQFYQNLFKEKQSTSENRFNSLLNDLNIASLNSEEMLFCEGNLTEQEIYKSLTSFKNNKSPGNDGLTKEFYCCFWNDIKYSFMKPLCESKKLKQLCVSQRQAIIKLLQKPNKDKRYVANWRPISLLNFDLKIISKSLATRLKNVLGKLIDARQTAYVNERFIGESGLLIDVLKVCNMQKLSSYLLTVDFEKAFDSLNHLTF